jgi:phage shock protein PspC (stress-responsive transcriptional regulator)
MELLRAPSTGWSNPSQVGMETIMVDVTIVVTINGMVFFVVLWLILPQKSSSAV